MSIHGSARPFSTGWPPRAPYRRLPGNPQRLTKHRHKKHDVVGALASDFSDNEGDESEEEDDDSITDTETLAVKAVSHGSYGPQGESSPNGGQGSKVISATAPTQVAIDKEATVLSAPVLPPPVPNANVPTGTSSQEVSGESRQLRDLQREVLTIQNNVLL